MAGINRRLDQLGRIVIPIEVRKKLKLQEGSLLEINLNQDSILLTKNEPLADLHDYIKDICSCINDCIVVCVSESDIVYASKPYNKHQNEQVDDAFFNQIIEHNGKCIKSCVFNQNFIITNKYSYFYSLSSFGDRHGYICFFYDDTIKEEQKGMMCFVAHYISSKL